MLGKHNTSHAKVKLTTYKMKNTLYVKLNRILFDCWDFILKRETGSAVARMWRQLDCRGALERGKKGKKEKKKTAYLTGLRVEFGQSFPTVPTRRSSGGVDGESNSPVINTTVKSRLLIILFSVCLRGLSSSRRKSAWSCVSHRGNGVDAFFLYSVFFYSRLFFFFFYFHSARWAGSEEWRRRELECLCLLADRLLNHMNIRACL